MVLIETSYECVYRSFRNSIDVNIYFDGDGRSADNGCADVNALVYERIKEIFWK